MRKRRVHPPESNRRRWVSIAGLILVIIACAAAIWHLSEEERVVTFPYLIDGDKLEVLSLFQYTGNNPDCGGEDGENIAVLALTNRAAKHMDYMEIVLKLESGEELVFEATDIPAGQAIWAFSTENLSCPANPVVRSLNSTVRFANEESLLNTAVQVQTAGTSVTLTNQTNQVLTELTLHCHTQLNKDYFGGLASRYPVGDIPVGGSVTVETADIGQGELVPVWVSQNKS